MSDTQMFHGRMITTDRTTMKNQACRLPPSAKTTRPLEYRSLHTVPSWRRYRTCNPMRYTPSKSNYELTDGTIVYSARDAYVWPASDFPGNAERVATFTFFGHHKNREFEYIICDETFPDDPATLINESMDWVAPIEHAFKQWQSSTSELVTVEHNDAGLCARGSTASNPTLDFIQQDDLQNEIRMLDVTAERVSNSIINHIWTFPELKSDVFKSCLAPKWDG